MDITAKHHLTPRIAGLILQIVTPNTRRHETLQRFMRTTDYALALSRRRGLRLYDFVCAWFDARPYFDFYLLHVVHQRLR